MEKKSRDNVISLLKQTYPMLLIDKVATFDKETAKSYKYITNSDPFMQGHFQNFKIYPVVLLVEFLAQTATFPIYERLGTINNIWFLSIDKCHCHGYLVPGDIAIAEVAITEIDPFGLIKCKGLIVNQNDEKILDAKFTLIKKRIQG